MKLYSRRFNLRICGLSKKIFYSTNVTDDSNDKPWAVGPTIHGASPSSSPMNPDPFVNTLKPIEFGRVRKREERKKERMLRNSETLKKINFIEKMINRPTEEQEQDAKELLQNRYEFLDKPPTLLYYRQFLAELRRYEMSWTQGSRTTLVLCFKLKDYGLDGMDVRSVAQEVDTHDYASKESTVLCNLRGRTDEISDCLTRMQVAVQSVLMGVCFGAADTSFDVDFRDEFNLHFKIRLRAVFPLEGTFEGDVSNGLISKEDAERLKSELSKPFFVVPGGPYKRYTQLVDADFINMQSGAVKPLWRGLTVQTVVFMHLMALKRFIRGTETGKPNIEYFPREMIDALRFTTVQFRTQIGMKPLDDLELNEFLPLR